MLRKSIWLLTAILITAPLVVFGIVHWFQNEYNALPYFGGNDVSIAGKEMPHQISDFEFINQDGKIYKSSISTKNKITVANFFFTSCSSICPTMMKHIKQLQNVYLNDSEITFISFTVDPVRDSAIKLKKYAAQYFINLKDWNLLTGDKREIYKLARKSFYLAANDGDGGEDDFIHSEQVVLIDKNKHIRGYYEGTKTNDIQQLILDIKKLEHEN